MQLDRVDRAIMKLLAEDARIAVSRMAEAVGLSQSACTRRIQALEGAGWLKGYGARFDHYNGFRAEQSPSTCNCF